MEVNREQYLTSARDYQTKRQDSNNSKVTA
jgi:hypothetical protein